MRPGIRRGDFTKEEEETIIKLHEMLGNRYILVFAFTIEENLKSPNDKSHTNTRRTLDSISLTSHPRPHANL